MYYVIRKHDLKQMQFGTFEDALAELRDIVRDGDADPTRIFIVEGTVLPLTNMYKCPREWEDSHAEDEFPITNTDK